MRWSVVINRGVSLRKEDYVVCMCFTASRVSGLFIFCFCLIRRLLSYTFLSDSLLFSSVYYLPTSKHWVALYNGFYLRHLPYFSRSLRNFANIIRCKKEIPSLLENPDQKLRDTLCTKMSILYCLHYFHLSLVSVYNFIFRSFI